MSAPERVLALAAMSPYVPEDAAPEWGDLLAREGLALGGAVGGEAALALVARWDALSVETREMLGADEIAGAARALWVEADADRRLALIAALSEGGWRSAGDLLVAALIDADPGVARAAGDVIERLAWAREGRRAVDLLVEQGLRTFALHRSRGVLGAAIACADAAGRRGPVWEAAGADDLRAAVGGALRAGASAAHRERAWELWGSGWISGPAGVRLSVQAGVEEHERVLSRGVLAIAARRKSAAAVMPERERAKLIEGLAPLRAGLLGRLSGAAWFGAAAVMREFGDTAGRREVFARAALGHRAAPVRLAAARLAPERTRIDYAFDAHAGTAVWAALASSGAEAPWAALARSPHAGVRLIASQELARAGEVWGLGSLEIVGLRRRLAADAAGVERAWRRAWEGASIGERGVLAAVAARAGMMAAVGEVVASAADPAAASGSEEAHLAATAASALGASGPLEGAARTALASCLGAEDARVRANAVEAFGLRRDRAAPAALAELKMDAHHRVRANAVRALAYRGGLPGSAVVVEIAAMLESERELDRRAGAWLAGRVASAGGPLDRRERRAAGAIIEQRLGREEEERAAARLRACAADLIGADLAEAV